MLTVVRFLILIAAVLAISPGVAAAKVIVTEKTKYYNVKGNNGFELSRQMLKGGRQNISLRHAIAATATNYSLSNADVTLKNGKCVVSNVSVKLEITYLYPKWVSQGGTSSTVRRNWQRFYAELLKHEGTHGAIAKQGARQVEQKIMQVKATPFRGCSDFRRKALTAFKTTTNVIRRRQMAFDRKEGNPKSRISQLQVALIKSE